MKIERLTVSTITKVPNSGWLNVEAEDTALVSRKASIYLTQDEIDGIGDFGPGSELLIDLEVIRTAGALKAKSADVEAEGK